MSTSLRLLFFSWPQAWILFIVASLVSSAGWTRCRGGAGCRWGTWVKGQRPRNASLSFVRFHILENDLRSARFSLSTSLTRTKPQAAKQEPASLSSPENESSIACFAYLEVLEKTVCFLRVCAGWCGSSRSWRRTRAGGNKGEWLQTRPLIPSCFVFGFIRTRLAVYLPIAETQTQQNMTLSQSALTNPLNWPGKRRVTQDLSASQTRLLNRTSHPGKSWWIKRCFIQCVQIISRSQTVWQVYIYSGILIGEMLWRTHWWLAAEIVCMAIHPLDSHHCFQMASDFMLANKVFLCLVTSTVPVFYTFRPNFLLYIVLLSHIECCFLTSLKYLLCF